MVVVSTGSEASGCRVEVELIERALYLQAAHLRSSIERSRGIHERTAAVLKTIGHDDEVCVFRRWARWFVERRWS